MDLYEVQRAAIHGSNESIWIDVEKICSIEQVRGKAVITFIGGSTVTVGCFQSFPKLVKSILTANHEDEVW